MEPGADRSARVGVATGLLVGLLGGLASGALGIGGGLIVVPLLSAWLGVPLKRAVGTSLVAVLVTALVAVIAETIVGPENLRWTAAASLAVTAVAGTVAGARLVARLHPARLGFLMAMLLVIAALRMSGLLHAAASHESSREALSGSAALAAHAAIGLLAGLIAALFGIGGGILAVPALAFLHPDWAFQACRATSLVLIVPTAAAGVLLHHRLGHVDARLVMGLLPGCAAGAVSGVLLANTVPGRPLEIAFAVLLLVSAAQLGRRAWVALRQRTTTRES